MSLTDRAGSIARSDEASPARTIASAAGLRRKPGPRTGSAGRSRMRPTRPAAIAGMTRFIGRTPPIVRFCSGVSARTAATPAAGRRRTTTARPQSASTAGSSTGETR